MTKLLEGSDYLLLNKYHREVSLFHSFITFPGTVSNTFKDNVGEMALPVGDLAKVHIDFFLWQKKKRKSSKTNWTCYCKREIIILLLAHFHVISYGHTDICVLFLFTFSVMGFHKCSLVLC